MSSYGYPAAIVNAIKQLQQFPGIGEKTAERMVLWLLEQKQHVLLDMSQGIQSIATDIKRCETCCFFKEDDMCPICSQQDSKQPILCIVEQPHTIFTIEKSNVFNGVYHVLGGKISPLNHVYPEDLSVDVLLRRLQQKKFQEVILALSPDIEGEATMHYLKESIAPYVEKVTTMAYGVPAGGNLDYADELTLRYALEGRQ